VPWTSLSIKKKTSEEVSVGTVIVNCGYHNSASSDHVILLLWNTQHGIDMKLLLITWCGCDCYSLLMPSMILCGGGGGKW